ncbi:hypothetical protein RclHR1_03080005 [Rhizophagus clarus]|uniref:Protein kinase domain-containing protein n=1 Tax=Rhizophagus clarus TaxID=94130 RepID=A0A2Z6S0F9_9GLOM|nr:hypothetical protein RclHR1_03080005 [Rhizophagus clarus]
MILGGTTEKSENTILDKFIEERRLIWIPYNQFDSVEYLDDGGFGTVYEANWKNENNIKVVLKCLNNLNEHLNEFLNEWDYYEKCFSTRIINLYGFTEHPDTLNYMVVIAIHKQNLIHGDFHDGNIFNTVGDKVFVSDLGLCRPVKSFLKKHDIYGVIPFMAPEVLRGKPYTSASDIYSFSMIMWEFTSGVPPFNNRAHDFQLSLSICKGERLEIRENTPQCYIDLMKKCWNEDPLKRPSASEISNIIADWIFRPYLKISKELKSNIMEFINVPIGNDEPITESHSQACYKSRLLDFTSKKSE